MMNHSLKNQCKVSPGTVIEGKWHHHRYRIIKELGFGANGVVYLAQFQNQQVAIKMSDNGMSITSEVNVLKSFAKVQGSTLGPSLIDVDDWVTKGSTVSFYVMEYIQGTDLLTFIQQKGHSWTIVLILQLLQDLEELHKNGWVFGDLKPENLMVTGPPSKIRCIDVGGTTIQGRAIKEFTEFYDRGYWGLGSRKAEPAYDLFSVAMVFINTAYPKRFNKTTGGLTQLKLMISQSKELKNYEEIILRALEGKYSSAKQMRNDLFDLINNRAHINQNKRNSPTTQRSANHRNMTRNTYKKKKKKGGMWETVLIVMIICMLYILYIYGQII